MGPPKRGTCIKALTVAVRGALCRGTHPQRWGTSPPSLFEGIGARLGPLGLPKSTISGPIFGVDRAPKHYTYTPFFALYQSPHRSRAVGRCAEGALRGANSPGPSPKVLEPYLASEQVTKIYILFFISFWPVFGHSWAQERAQRPRLEKRHRNRRKLAREIDSEAPPA